ncbi:MULTISPECIES: hypothetical protein [unclassified Microbispora]|uniref:hypothetical protein n=1 Tax=Microbispora sp. CL1-1 TaxID=2720026 RepID=UPI001F1100AD|nr:MULTISPECIES: hypothetical protein [unclassified Microbispora]
MSGDRRGGRRRREGGIRAQDALVRPSQRFAGIDAEVFGEQTLDVVEDVQRLGLPPAAVEREHLQLPGTLPQRGLRGQPGDRVERFLVPAQPQQRVGPVLPRRLAQAFQPGAFRLAERAGKAAQGGARPQPQPGLQLAQPGGEVLFGLETTGLGEALLEVLGVGPAHVPRQAVAVRGLGEQRERPAPAAFRFEQPPQPGHIGVDALLGRLRRGVAPQGADEPVLRDEAARLCGEHPESGPLQRRPQVHLPVLQPCGHRSEHPEPEAAPA